MSGTWASGWALNDIVTVAEFAKGVGNVADSTLGASAASIDFVGLPTTYAHLMIVVYARSDNASASTNAFIRFNGDATANYDHQQFVGSAATASAAEAFAASGAVFSFIPANTAGANLFGTATIVIPNYGGATNNKSLHSTYSLKTGTATGNLSSGSFAGHWRSSAAINRVTILTAGNLVSGTRVGVYVFGA